ncbi:MAG: phospho-N-acetylmuramoyl-pentapeptide-transferase [Deltaproteobacteria bacterium]|nr:phospho-N-acetylmuramoyl-pentapeptide-transferase [Deltaproteobacteria bacterium]
MLYWVLYKELGINLFRYPSTRILSASVVALLLSIYLGPVFIRWLRRMAIGQEVRDDGPSAHKEKKQGTPTMGGTLILFCTTVPTILFSDLENRYVWFVLIVLLGYGFVGFVDDFRKVALKNTKGLPGRYKLMGQAFFGLVALAFLFYATPYTTDLYLPFVKPTIFSPNITIYVYVPFALLVLMGTSNAVNLTDGLDGLAIVPTVISAAVFLALAYAAGATISGFNLAEYLRIPQMPGAEELAVLCGALCGAGLGFLWYNAHPAEVFMGDVGALGLGGALGAFAIVTKNELVSAIVHGVFLAEALSVMLQVGSYKLRKKRIFKMAPLHHHFELSGWPEAKVIVRFWIISVLLAMVGLATLKLR